MKRVAALVALAAGVLLVLWALLAEKTDEERIRAVLDQLEAAVRIEGEAQNPVFRLAHLNEAFSEIFTDDVSISIPELSSLRSGRQALASLAARATSYAEAVDVDFLELQVDVGTSGLANVRGIARVEAVRTRGQREVDERRVSFRFVEREGDWRIDMLRAEPKDYGAD